MTLPVPAAVATSLATATHFTPDCSASRVASLLQPFFLACDQDEVYSFGGQGLGNCKTDADACTGNNGNFSFQIKIHSREGCRRRL